MTRHWTDSDIPDLNGKLALVTGANSGLGLCTTRGLASRGAKVLMACRDPVKGRATMQQISAEVPGARLEIQDLDLADLASVRRLAANLSRRYGRLDLLCNNAGVMALPQRRTRDGFEMRKCPRFPVIA